MTVAENKVVSVHYTLTESTADGPIVETTNGKEPFAFIYGIGSTLPEFESNLLGLKVGDTFAFGIEAINAYGPYYEDEFIEIPKKEFEIDGKLPEGITLEKGTFIPLTNQNGDYLEGMVISVDLNNVKIDLNHPMAGVDIFFTGHIESIRDADVTEIAHGHVHGAGGHHH